MTENTTTAVGLKANEGVAIPRKRVFSWVLWDWATQPYNSVILTFVFTALYLTSDSFIAPELAALADGSPAKDRAIADLTSGLGLAITIAGVLVALLAPVLGQRSDASGSRKRWLFITTTLLAVTIALLFFVQASPSFFVLGVGLVAAASVVSEIAGVQYNAMLVQVSTPATVGKVSGLGWGFGYLGGIIALVIVVVCTSLDWFGMSTDNGLVYRVIALGCAVWIVLFSIPLFLNVPEATAAPAREKVGFFRSYVELVRDVARLFRDDRQTFWFLVASAVYRDGLAGVFTFGAVIAAVTFRFSSNEVLIFGVAANLVAGVSTIVSGRFDDRFGPRAVILTSLVGLLVAALAVFFLHDGGTTVFWIGGLFLCVFVGPAQAASRSLLARVTPPGREGEIFGLYATTGRAASFLSPALWTVFIAAFGATYWGIIGLAIVLLAGLILMLLVKAGARVQTR
jgi:UMF1 family MFS transporter